MRHRRRRIAVGQGGTTVIRQGLEIRVEPDDVATSSVGQPAGTARSDQVIGTWSLARQQSLIESAGDVACRRVIAEEISPDDRVVKRGVTGRDVDARAAGVGNIPGDGAIRRNDGSITDDSAAVITGIVAGNGAVDQRCGAVIDEQTCAVLARRVVGDGRRQDFERTVAIDVKRRRRNPATGS